MNKEEITSHIREAIEASKKADTLVLQDLGEIPSDVVKGEIVSNVFAPKTRVLPNLKEFHIINCAIKRDDFRFIAAGLKSSKTITLVNLSGINFDDNVARDLALVIKSNQVIKSLCILDSIITEKGIKMIATAIKDSKTLESLLLNGTPLSNVSCEHISEMLNGNTSLKYLHMKECKVSSHGLFVISQALKFNKTLRRIDLSQNNFDSKYGMENLGLALKDNSTLQVLDLNNNSIDDEAAAAIFMGLGRNTSVVNFAMGGIDVREPKDSPAKSVVEMAKMLKTNKTLKYLSVFSFVFRNPGMKLISEAIKKNNTLEEIAIFGNEFDVDGAKYLLDALDVNKTLLNVHLTKDDDLKINEILNPKEADDDDNDDDDYDSDIDEDDLMIIPDDMFMEFKKKLSVRKEIN